MSWMFRHFVSNSHKVIIFWTLSCLHMSLVCPLNNAYGKIYGKYELFPSFPRWDGMLMFVALASVRSVVSVWIPTVSSAGFADHRCINQGFGPRCFGICHDCQWNGFCSITGPRNQHLPGVKMITICCCYVLFFLTRLFFDTQLLQKI